MEMSIDYPAPRRGTLRTLSMAIVVSIARAIVAFPIAYYMARYTTGKTKAFFYIAVMMPMWASYIVKLSLIHI